ncbi:hypothetical protein ACFWIB_19825 [Streptomyces sp. NPDC127051]
MTPKLPFSRTKPVSYVWIDDVLGMTTSRRREDRLLHEVEAACRVV